MSVARKWLKPWPTTFPSFSWPSLRIQFLSTSPWYIPFPTPSFLSFPHQFLSELHKKEGRPLPAPPTPQEPRDRHTRRVGGARDAPARRPRRGRADSRHVPSTGLLDDDARSVCARCTRGVPAPGEGQLSPLPLPHPLPASSPPDNTERDLYMCPSQNDPPTILLPSGPQARVV